MANPAPPPVSRAPRRPRPPRPAWWFWLLRLAVLGVLALVFTAYQNPHRVVELANWVWSCF